MSGGVNAGTVFIDVKYDTDKAGAALERELQRTGAKAGAALGTSIDRATSQKMKAMADSWAKTGQNLTFGMTAPLALLGKQAVQGFAEYDRQLGMIEGLVGESREQVQAWSADLLKMSSAYGINAKEAAAGLYFITSSGLSGADAMKTLDIALKGSAVGLGKVQTVADVATSAMNAYRASGLSAAQAADILTVAVREGKAEPDALAGALATVIPIASELGVSFDQVAGAAAAMTLNGTSADEAATQLRAVLNALLKPSKQAEDGLASVGLSASGLRSQLASEGLLPALQKVTNAFEGNAAATALVFDDVRALSGVMSILGQKTDTTRAILDQTKNSAGALGKAMDVTATRDSFKLRQATEGLNNSLTEIGATVVPLVASFAEAGATGASAFAALPDPLKATAVGMAGVAALAGPVAYGMSGIARAAGGIGVGLEAITSFRIAVMAAGGGASGLTTATRAAINPTTGLGQALGAAGISAAAAAAAYALWNAKMEEGKRLAADLGSAYLKGLGKNSGLGAAEAQIKKTEAEIASLNAEIASSSAPWDADYRAQLEMGVRELERSNDATRARIALAKDAAKATGLDANSIVDWLEAQEAAGTKVTEVGKIRETLVKAAEGGDVMAKQALATGTAMTSLASRTKQAQDAFASLTTAGRGMEDAQRRVESATEGLSDAETDLQDARRARLEVDRQIADAQRRAEDAHRRVTDAVNRQADAQRALNELLAGPTEDTQLGVESAKLSLEEAEKRLAELGKTKPGQKAEPVDPLERRRAELDLRRAKLDYERALGEHARQVTDAKRHLAEASDAVLDAQRNETEAIRAVEDARLKIESADERVRDAEYAVRDAAIEVRRAHEDGLQAALNMAGAHEAFALALQGSSSQAGPMLDFLDQLKTKYPEVAASIQTAIDKLRFFTGEASTADKFKAWREAHPGVTGPPSPEQVDEWWRRTHPVAARAFGGPLRAGQLSTVNELGRPEMWESNGRQYLLPVSSGRVIPLKASSFESGKANGPRVGTVIENMNITAAPQPKKTAQEIRRELDKKAYLAGGV